MPRLAIRDGVMLPSNAAALVGAGVVSVLLFPAAATILNRKASGPKQDSGEPAPVAGATGEEVTGFDQGGIEQAGVDPGVARPTRDQEGQPGS